MNWVYLSIDIFIHFIIGRVIFYALDINQPTASVLYLQNFLCFTFVATLLILNITNSMVIDVEEMD
jgi:hypothetical protein